MGTLTPAGTDAGPTAPENRRLSAGWFGWMIFTALWVPAATLAITGGLAGLLHLSNPDTDGSDGGMGGFVFLAIFFWGVPVMYIFWSFIALAKAPAGRSSAALVGAALTPILLYAGFQANSRLDEQSDTRASAVIESIDGSDNIEGFGPMIPTYLGRSVDAEETMLTCSTQPVWSTQYEGRTSGDLANELEWIQRSEQLLIDHGFQVTTGFNTRDRAQQPNRTERATLVTFGRRNDEAVVFFTEFWFEDEIDGIRSFEIGIHSVRDSCITGMDFSDLDQRRRGLAAVESPLPTDVPGFADAEGGGG